MDSRRRRVLSLHDPVATETLYFKVNLKWGPKQLKLHQIRNEDIRKRPYHQYITVTYPLFLKTKRIY